MYRCMICGLEFDHPLLVIRNEIVDNDGNRERQIKAVCPSCWMGEQYFENTEET